MILLDLHAITFLTSPCLDFAIISTGHSYIIHLIFIETEDISTGE